MILHYDIFTNWLSLLEQYMKRDEICLKILIQHMKSTMFDGDRLIATTHNIIKLINENYDKDVKWEVRSVSYNYEGNKNVKLIFYMKDDKKIECTMEKFHVFENSLDVNKLNIAYAHYDAKMNLLMNETPDIKNPFFKEIHEVLTDFGVKNEVHAMVIKSVKFWQFLNKVKCTVHIRYAGSTPLSQDKEKTFEFIKEM